MVCTCQGRGERQGGIGSASYDYVETVQIFQFHQRTRTYFVSLKQQCLPIVKNLYTQTENYKIIYRRYAGLFFSVAVDLNENELTYLELIHLFVESMDIYFGNVCELDIVFNFQKVYMLLDEVILGGEILETSKRAIRDKMIRMDEIMEKEQVSFVSRLFGADT